MHFTDRSSLDPKPEWWPDMLTQNEIDEWYFDRTETDDRPADEMTRLMVANLTGALKAMEKENNRLRHELKLLKRPKTLTPPNDN
jgi:hypothetical protein